MGKLMISNLVKSLSVIAVVGLALVGSSRVSEARSFPARGGSSSYHSDANCWIPNGPTMTNSCASEKFWYIPLLLDGTAGGWVAVTAQGASSISNVRCIGTSSNSAGTVFIQTGWYNLPSFGAAKDIWLFLSVPSGGSAMIDCGVGPGGKVHTLNW